VPPEGADAKGAADDRRQAALVALAWARFLEARRAELEAQGAQLEARGAQLEAMQELARLGAWSDLDALYREQARPDAPLQAWSAPPEPAHADRADDAHIGGAAPELPGWPESRWLGADVVDFIHTRHLERAVFVGSLAHPTQLAFLRKAVMAIVTHLQLHPEVPLTPEGVAVAMNIGASTYKRRLRYLRSGYPPKGRGESADTDDVKRSLPWGETCTTSMLIEYALTILHHVPAAAPEAVTGGAPPGRGGASVETHVHQRR
jgi:hypothetical protein